jgi:hypothetical protein
LPHGPMPLRVHVHTICAVSGEKQGNVR